ncbi:peptidoglycan DD-metalloendopeptidase family protein [Paeniglutamicibacter sp. R2-26]|uniref:peptidoglycan DD-metalloendopeptidase family protein n=1 Tax=Paeniglutamicibacter sp. R2-26 TaxID=3144417 RepID=UPI003EE4D538
MVALPTVAGARLTDTFGWQDWRGYSHAGIDFAGIRPGEQPKICAVDDGVVEFAGNNLVPGRNGYHTGIRHGDGYLTFYGHVSGSKVRKGDKVKRGEHIATMDHVGLSAAAGIHCHFEVWDAKDRLVDPLKWLAERGVHFKTERPGEKKRLQPPAVIAPAGKPKPRPPAKPASKPAAKPKKYTTVRRGSKGPTVGKVQAALHKQGYSKQTRDNVFGAQTEANVRDFQRRTGLRQDGVAGPITQKRLGL